MLVRRAGNDDLAQVLDVWRRANTARGHPPDKARIDRVRAKLADPEALLVVAVDGPATVGMALAEPGRDDPTLCHISMVFVAPERWRTGVARRLLRAIAAAGTGYTRLQVWTRTTNEPAAALYRACGFAASGRTATLDTGEVIAQYVATTAAVAG